MGCLTVSVGYELCSLLKHPTLRYIVPRQIMKGRFRRAACTKSDCLDFVYTRDLFVSGVCFCVGGEEVALRC
jgi:hypothetical protein